MHDANELTTPQLLCAVIALAGVLGVILKTLFAAHIKEKQDITKAYLDNVKAATQVHAESAKAMSKLADSIVDLTDSLHKHDDRMSQQHQQLTKAVEEGKA